MIETRSDTCVGTPKMYEKYSRVKDKGRSMIRVMRTEVKVSVIHVSFPRDMSLDVQSCYSSNPSQPLLCRDKVSSLYLKQHFTKQDKMLMFPGGRV